MKGIRIEDRYGKGEARKGDHSGGSGNCHCRLGLDRVTTAPALSANRCRPVRRPDARRCRTTCAGPYHHGHPPEWPIQAGCDSWQNWAHAARSVRWDDDVRISDLEPRFTCRACGQRRRYPSAVRASEDGNGRRLIAFLGAGRRRLARWNDGSSPSPAGAVSLRNKKPGKRAGQFGSISTAPLG